ncbi:hypothetical protein [Lihuaxuella thermophila]|uniref:hypothetical protein n=1 Tax=Lihuaxuella thermophila TaxID=1173111 RepID=UPI000B7F343F|nr:hypothetical protein [Lihuaxuella thermophila]
MNFSNHKSEKQISKPKTVLWELTEEQVKVLQLIFNQWYLSDSQREIRDQLADELTDLAVAFEEE